MSQSKIGVILTTMLMILLKTYTKLEASVDGHAPLKKLTPKEIKIRSKPWLSIEILKMIKIRNKIFARKKRQLNNDNCKR